MNTGADAAATIRAITYQVVVFVERSPLWGEFPGEKLMQVQRWAIEIDALTPPEAWVVLHQQVQTLLATMQVAQKVTPMSVRMASDIREALNTYFRED